MHMGRHRAGHERVTILSLLSSEEAILLFPLYTSLLTMILSFGVRLRLNGFMGIQTTWVDNLSAFKLFCCNVEVPGKESSICRDIIMMIFKTVQGLMLRCHAQTGVMVLTVLLCCASKDEAGSSGFVTLLTTMRTTLLEASCKRMNEK